MKKIKNIEIDILESEYQNRVSDFERLSIELQRQIQYLFDKNGISLAVPLQSRTKKWDSIFRKINQQIVTIKSSILELQDLVGLRVILLFKKDIEKVSEIIKENFLLIREYNTNERLGDSEFGYNSTHIIVELSESWLKVPIFSNFQGIKIEIQIRTLSQHAWAEASNIFQYKNENNVPPPLKRSISRISALLEIVDFEFDRILQERLNYKHTIVGNKNDIQELNVDLLEEILKDVLKDREIDISDSSLLIQNLFAVDVKTNADLKQIYDTYLSPAIDFEKKLTGKMIKKIKSIRNRNDDNNEDENQSSVEGYIIEWSEKLEKGIYFSSGGLIRLMLELKFGRSIWDEIKARDENEYKDQLKLLSEKRSGLPRATKL